MTPWEQFEKNCKHTPEYMEQNLKSFIRIYYNIKIQIYTGVVAENEIIERGNFDSEQEKQNAYMYYSCFSDLYNFFKENEFEAIAMLSEDDYDYVIKLSEPLEITPNDYDCILALGQYLFFKKKSLGQKLNFTKDPQEMLKIYPMHQHLIENYKDRIISGKIKNLSDLKRLYGIDETFLKDAHVPVDFIEQYRRQMGLDKQEQVNNNISQVQNEQNYNQPTQTNYNLSFNPNDTIINRGGRHK